MPSLPGWPTGLPAHKSGASGPTRDKLVVMDPDIQQKEPEGMQKMKRRTLTDSVFRQLQAAILHGDLAPGDTMPPERTIADDLGNNRGAIREALKKLENENLIETRQGGKTRVLNYRETAGLNVIGDLIFNPSGEADRSVIQSLIELRVTIQPDLARLAVLRGGKELLPALRKIIVELNQPDLQPVSVHQLTEEFWEELGRHSGNISYRLILNTLKSIRESLALDMRDSTAAYRNVSHFERIADAVESGDPEAAQLAAKERSDMIGAAISKLMTTHHR